MQFRLGRFIFTQNFRITKLEDAVAGFRSNLNNYSIYDPRNRHIPMIDADDVSEIELEKDIIKLQKRFLLGDARILVSNEKTVFTFHFQGDFHF